MKDRPPVSASAWQRFSDDVLTAAFPAGFTVFDAAGQWQDPSDRHVVKEPTKVVRVVLPHGAAMQIVQDVAERYRVLFHQTSVGIALDPICAAF